MKVLLLDLETAPNLGHVWGLWQQNVGLPQLIASGYTLCWAAKWYGDKELMFNSIHKTNAESMVSEIYELVNSADAVVHYNGTKFDMPTLNKEFLLHGLTPPAPYKNIDLLGVARRQFRFPSNKLDYIAQALKLGKKTKHVGHELWIGCMNGDEESWKQMEEYNRNDVILLEKLYDKFKPWIRSTANQGLFREDNLCCPACGSTRYQRRGYANTASRRYQRYHCTECGNWFRSSKCEPGSTTKYVNVAS